MVCGFLTLQERQGAPRLCVISPTHCRFPAPSNDYRVYTANPLCPGEHDDIYIGLGYLDEKQWDTLSDSERNAQMDACFAYDDVLRKHGHCAGGEGLHTAQSITTLRWKHGQVSITDGPYAETKEQLGGILVLEATDLHHAVQLMSKYPRVKASAFEMRPAEA